MLKPAIWASSLFLILNHLILFIIIIYVQSNIIVKVTVKHENKNLKEIIYFERKNADIEEVKKCKIKFSKEKQIIEKYDESDV